MAQDEVKARRVGDSVVVTIPKPILVAADTREGDMLRLEVLADGNVIVKKASNTSSLIGESDWEWTD